MRKSRTSALEQASADVSNRPTPRYRSAWVSTTKGTIDMIKRGILPSQTLASGPHRSTYAYNHMHLLERR